MIWTDHDVLYIYIYIHMYYIHTEVGMTPILEMVAFEAFHPQAAPAQPLQLVDRILILLIMHTTHEMSRFSQMEK